MHRSTVIVPCADACTIIPYHKLKTGCRVFLSASETYAYILGLRIRSYTDVIHIGVINPPITTWYFLVVQFLLQVSFDWITYESCIIPILDGIVDSRLLTQ
jgi:hypothetical protein